jgi:hypothetical protein
MSFPQKPTVPFHWTPVLLALGLTPAQRLTLLYLAAGMYPVEGEPGDWRRIEAAKATASTTWLVEWPVEHLEDVSGVDRNASIRIKAALRRSGLACRVADYDREAEISEVWDVTALHALAPATVDKVAAEVAAKMTDNTIRKAA